MDDIGNILYILAMLAALVFSAIKKQKQAKKPRPMPENESRPEHDPMQEPEEDILGELRELFQKPQQEVVKEEKVKKVAKDVPLYMQAKKKETKRAMTSKKEHVKVGELEDDNEGFEFDKEQIDLRQAVIYSEILKRPYV
ncbi:hypothetical protein [Carboxylicivirga marina]|uniref:Uncharacterized protein n=1 Tax=Carboxylicivirga marina TaxID=2800988 RepID=A0ABS1HII5_9BACT|nr:hypothetical protein [Carboxylicivirga marina]MBK3517476.1 hypothetical protein [Carboxylicivirga marina]